MEEKHEKACSWLTIPVSLERSNVIQVFKDYLLSICRPEWEKVNIEFRSINEGLGVTNDLVGLSPEGISSKDVVLIRINGQNTDSFINREMELLVRHLLYQAGMSPPVLCKFQNGLCYEFAQGRTIQREDLQDGGILRCIAVAVAKMHNLSIPYKIKKEPMILNLFDEWFSKVPMSFENEKTNTRFLSVYGSRDSLQQKIDEAKQLLSKFKSPIALCHNDLQFGNLIYDSSAQKITLIDVEYAGMNHVACELGDFFSEFAGLDPPDYTLYPTEAKQKEFIRMYLEECANLKGKPTFGVVTTDIIIIVNDNVCTCISGGFTKIIPDKL